MLAARHPFHRSACGHDETLDIGGSAFISQSLF
jgi:hypothetical protein